MLEKKQKLDEEQTIHPLYSRNSFDMKKNDLHLTFFQKSQ